MTTDPWSAASARADSSSKRTRSENEPSPAALAARFSAIVRARSNRFSPGWSALCRTTSRLLDLRSFPRDQGQSSADASLER